MKKKRNKYTKKKADELFSKIIRKAGKCRKCGSKYNLQCAHIVSRRYYNTRWDLENAVCLCQKCHMYYTFRPLEWEIWVNRNIGPNTYKRLKLKALQYVKTDYEKIIEDLTEIV